MDDDEDWDSLSKLSSKPPQQSGSTPHQTLKITDGYKYSYEALSSPANIEDWVDGPSYGGSKRSSIGYAQSSFRDNNRSFRNERSNSNKRFDSLKHSDNFSSKSSPRNFSTPKSTRFTNRSLTSVNTVSDWDAPSNSSDQINGSWKGSANVSVNIPTEEDWDNGDAVSQTKPVDIPMYNPNSSKQNISSNENEDWASGNDKSLNESQSISTNSAPKSKSWDQMSEPSTKKKSISSSDMYNSDSSIRNLEQRNSTGNMEEDWDLDPSDPSTSSSSRNGFSKDIPMYNPNNSNGQSYSNSPFNQRYENNYHSSKHQHSRSFESSDRFSREPYSRHSRGNRHSPYERGSRGRGGGRGGRGSRSSRDSSYQSYNSRDSSRNRGDRRESSYQHSSYSKSRNSDRSSYQAPSASFKNTPVEEEEDWESPTGFVQKSSENNAPLPPVALPAAQIEEESWD